MALSKQERKEMARKAMERDRDVLTPLSLFF